MIAPSAGISVGVVGATGVVGETFLSLLEERQFPTSKMRLFASENSLGSTRRFAGRDLPVETLSENCFDGLDLVFFSSGDEISREWAPKAARSGAYAIDNSAAFRMDSAIPLVVPEVNGELLAAMKQDRRGGIIANPNCSTIQLVVALKPLAKHFGLRAVRVATYQSVSGAGRNGIEELLESTRLSLEGEDLEGGKTFPAPIAFNCIPQIGRIDETGFCTEETKIMNETRKILSLPDLAVSAFTVRVPTLNAHAEAAWVTLAHADIKKSEIENCLANAPGIELQTTTNDPDRSAPPGSPTALGYATQRTSSGRNPVFVGRLHRDQIDPHTWLMWIVADNLRKGAALNGLQIAETLFPR